MEVALFYRIYLIQEIRFSPGISRFLPYSAAYCSRVFIVGILGQDNSNTSNLPKTRFLTFLGKFHTLERI